MSAPFRSFAKVHDTSRGQVLVAVEENGDGLPAISVSCVLASGIHVKVSIGGWADNEEGWSKADNAFALFDADAAENFAHKIVPQFEGGAS